MGALGHGGDPWAGEERGAGPERGPVAGAPAEWRVVGGGAHSGRGSDSLPVFCTPDESSEEEEEEEEDELEEEEDEAGGGYRLGARERALSPGLEESGLGLLARFAASALPSPTVGPSLSVVQLEAKQKARKKEERQSLMGKYQQMGCREVGTVAPNPASRASPGLSSGALGWGSWSARPKKGLPKLGSGLRCSNTCDLTACLTFRCQILGSSGEQRP